MMGEHKRRCVAIAVIFAVLVLATSSIWMPSGVMLSADVVAERPFVAEIFYCTHKDGKFGHGNMHLATIRRGVSRLEVLLGADSIARLRFDCGVKPGRVVLSNVRLVGREVVSLDAGDFAFSPDVERHDRMEDGALLVESEKKDPYIVYKKTVDVVGCVHVANLWRNAPSVALWLLLMFLVSRLVVGVFADVAARIAVAWSLGALPEQGVGGRISSLDYVRVAAFVLVVMAHVMSQAGVSALPPRLGLSSTYWGALGVALFFMLSGASLAIGSFKGGYGAFYLKRLRALLPPFWVAYFVCLFLIFASCGTMKMGSDWMKIVQTLFGIDSYLRSSASACSQFSNYSLIGEWYLGCILILYSIAPAVYRLASKWPVPTLIGTYAASLLSIAVTPTISGVFPLWNSRPHFNATSHLFELAFGMVFIRCVRPRFRLYATLAAVSLVSVVAYSLYAPSPLFANDASGIIASVALFVFVCFVFDALSSSEALRGIVSYLGKISFLAFLYHHQMIYLLIDKGYATTMQKLVYCVVLILAVSFAMASLSLKPVDAVRRLVFGDGAQRNASS